jgi:hypothetical protein
MNPLLPARTPRIFRARQRIAPAPRLGPTDFSLALREPLGALLSGLKPGARVAVAVGSRGIPHLATLVREVLDILQAANLERFIVPAMGSHGGASPEGQRCLLADYGVTEAALGVPVLAAMEAECIGRSEDGVDLYCGREALRADAVVLINRVKPHTDFAGTIGSGLLKMAVVGLGKHAGALAFHRAAHRFGYERTLRSLAHVALSRLPILGGVAILEGPSHALAGLCVVPARELEAREPELAAEAARLMPRLPLDEIDLLIVDRLGKNISGTGMDPNVIGRPIHGYSLLEAENRFRPLIRRIFVRDLTPETHGNATGVGMADFTTTRLVQAIDRTATYTNALTAMSLQGSKIPIHFATDRECIAQALASLPLPDPLQARIVRIADTGSLEVVELSEIYADDIRCRPIWEPLGPPAELAYDPHGNLAP